MNIIGSTEKRVHICTTNGRQFALLPAIGFTFGGFYWRFAFNFMWLNIVGKIGIKRGWWRP